MTQYEGLEGELISLEEKAITSAEAKVREFKARQKAVEEELTNQ